MIQILSPAKINLMLRILGRRDDGYHELQTCFKILPWGDQMRFVVLGHDGCAVTVSGFSGLPQENNLIHHAVELLKPLAQKPSVVSIDVEKVIPTGGGLGGGSSNAATTLKVMNEVWACGLSTDQIMKLALTLGADVPVFITGTDAIATGVGEQLRPHHFPLKHVLLMFPDCHVNTAAVFSHPELKRDQWPVPLAEINERRHWVNDCLEVVLKTQPAVKQIHQFMCGVAEVYLSGTGATLFALFDDQKAALKAKKMAQSVCPCHLVSF